MDDLTIGDFASALGREFRLELDGEPVVLTLDQAQALPDSVRESGSFRLQFRGPHQPLLEQATYALQGDEAVYDIFLVPIARDSECSTYEAIFN